MSALPDPLEWLSRPAEGDGRIDRKALAGLLVHMARNMRPDVPVAEGSVRPPDVRLEQLRTLLLGREIEELSRLSEVMDDPERLAGAVGRVLPSAFAQAAEDARLGQVLAPTLEKATQSSIRRDPHALLNILYPLIVPAIRKSVGDSIGKTFQSLNETLKHSLTWRGLKWRWEAWRTGVSFAEVVLKHTLVYQVEHVLLIHRHTGLLICHAASDDATTQDPQLVSAMLTAIQDFVRDSFRGAGRQGLDTLRLGEFWLWSEAGPSATLVAAIRGNPPEELHEALIQAVARIHAERHRALEDFTGDSSGFADIEAELASCLAHRRQTQVQPRARLLWLILALAVLLAAGTWEYRRWQDARRWDDYLALLRTQPGIVPTQAGWRDGRYTISGLRDPLAADPGDLLTEAGIDPTRVVAHWTPYEALDPMLVLKRLQASLAPPSSVVFNVEGNRIVGQGRAPSAWLRRAEAVGRLLPAGAPSLDLSAITNVDSDIDHRWEGYLARLGAQPGIIVTEAGHHDGKFQVTGLRDPLAADPQQMLAGTGINADDVVSRWAPFEGLDPQLVLKRLRMQLEPPAGVTLALDGNRVVAKGSAPMAWIDRARVAARMLPAGAPGFDLSGVQSVGGKALVRVRDAIQSQSISFNYNESLPAPGQDTALDQLAAELKDLAALSEANLVHARVMLTGHSDDIGTNTSNLSLSVARAEAVRALLKKRKVEPDLLAVRGAGALEPLQPDTSEAGRSLNRRVSFTVEIEEQP